MYPQPGIPTTNMYGIQENDPARKLIDTSNVTSEELRQISRLMKALGELKDTERRVSEASAKYMKLNQTDMRAIHFLIVQENLNHLVTAREIAAHLGISGPSTTKLLDRLESAGHLTRSSHPTDRRALQIRVTPETRRVAYETVGKHQSRRFNSALRLNEEEREVVIRFLEDMTNEIDPSDVDWTSAG